MAYDKITFSLAPSGVATIALNEPETRNALSDELLSELVRALEACRDDPAVRCLVLTSTHHSVFSSGGNLGGFAAEVPLVHKHFATSLFPEVFALLGQLGKPSICAANGHVLAGAAHSCFCSSVPNARIGGIAMSVWTASPIASPPQLAWTISSASTSEE